MPVKQQVRDRAATKDDFLAVINREIAPVLKALRLAWNRSTSLPATIEIASGELELDWTLSRQYHVSLLGPVAEAVFTDPDDVGEYFVIVDTEGGGNDISLWPANVIWVGGSAPTITAAAGRTDVIRLYWDGDRYIGDARQDAS